jgi:hypothetical protein
MANPYGPAFEGLAYNVSTSEWEPMAARGPETIQDLMRQSSDLRRDPNADFEGMYRQFLESGRYNPGGAVGWSTGANELWTLDPMTRAAYRTGEIQPGTPWGATPSSANPTDEEWLQLAGMAAPVVGAAYFGGAESGATAGTGATGGTGASTVDLSTGATGSMVPGSSSWGGVELGTPGTVGAETFSAPSAVGTFPNTDLDFFNTLSSGNFDPAGFGGEGFGSGNFNSFGAGEFAPPDMGMPGYGYNPGTSGGFSWEEILKRLRTGQGLGGALSVGSGLYGIYQSNQMRKLADQASSQQDPFGPHRAQYAAELSALRSDPSRLTALPGYKAGLQAVERRMASQGYLGSGNMMTALHQEGGRMYDAEVARLSTLAGANIGPNNTRLQGNISANDILSRSLASLGYGAMGLWRQ